MAVDEQTINKILDTIMKRESGGRNIPNQSAKGKSSASGLFQFTNSTWASAAKAAGYGQYANGRAMDAPPEVQRAVAANMVRGILLANKGDVRAVPLNWYYPAGAKQVLAGGDVQPPGAGNPLSMRQYMDAWMKDYNGPAGPAVPPGYQVPQTMARVASTPVNTNVALPADPEQLPYPVKPSTKLADYGPTPVLPKAWVPYYEDPVAQQQRLDKAFPLPVAEAEAIQKRILAENNALYAQQQAEYQRQADLERQRTQASQQFVQRGLGGIGDIAAAATLANKADSAAAAQAAIAQLAQAGSKGMEAFFPGGAAGAADSIGQILQANIGQGLLSQMGQAQLDQAQRAYQTNQQFGLAEANARYGRQDTLLGGAQTGERDKAQVINQSRQNAYQGGLTQYEQQNQDRRTSAGIAGDNYNVGSANVRDWNDSQRALWTAKVNADYTNVDNNLKAQELALRQQAQAAAASGDTGTAEQKQWQFELTQKARTQMQRVQNIIGVTTKSDGSWDASSIGKNYDPTAAGAANAAYGTDASGKVTYVGFNGQPSSLNSKQTSDIVTGWAIDSRVNGEYVDARARAKDLATSVVLAKYRNTKAPSKVDAKGKPVDTEAPVIEVKDADGKTHFELNPNAALRTTISKEIDDLTSEYIGQYNDLTVAPTEDTQSVLDGMLTAIEANKAAQERNGKAILSGKLVRSGTAQITSAVKGIGDAASQTIRQDEWQPYGYTFGEMINTRTGERMSKAEWDARTKAPKSRTS